jgi:hypothetical protein
MHVHVKLPGVFSQVARGEQGETSESLHSSMSAHVLPSNS